MSEGHKKLQIYRQAHQLAIAVHAMTLKLPSSERFEEGSQIRRSSKSVVSNIVEGYALRRYKNEFIHFLFRAYGSSEETLEYLELLRDTNSLSDVELFGRLHGDCDNLCGKILRYIQAIDESFEMPTFMKEPEVPYQSFDSPSSNPEPQTPEQ